MGVEWAGCDDGMLEPDVRYGLVECDDRCDMMEMETLEDKTATGQTGDIAC